MSKRNRHAEYNRVVKLIDAGNTNIAIPIRLLEEFGSGKKLLPKENKDELEVE